MTLGANLPTASIAELGNKIMQEASTLEADLNKLRAACQRDPSFTGSAAVKYDEYISQWDQSQKGMVEALRGAGSLLQDFAAKLEELNISAAQGFNI